MSVIRAFVPSIVGHTALGIALAVLVWTVGLGATALLARRFSRPLEPADALLAYPLGLAALLVASFVVLLLGPAGAALAALVLGLPLLGLRRAGAPLRGLALSLWGGLRALPFVLGFAVVLGAFYHGPTARIDSHAFGDALWYVARLARAHGSALNLKDSLAYGFHWPLAESGPSLIGGALWKLVPLDPFFIDTSMLSAFLLASLAIGLGLAGAFRRPAHGTVAALAPLLLAVVAYPSWIAESPPIALALPLAFPVYRLLRRAGPGPGEFVAYAAAIVFCLAFTKILAGVSVLLLLIAAAVIHHRDAIVRRRRMVVGVVTVVLAAVGLFLGLRPTWYVHLLGLRFGPVHDFRPVLSVLRHRQTHAAGLALFDLGALLLAALLLRLRQLAVAGAFGAAVLVSWIVDGASVAIAIGVAILVAALVLAESPPERRGDRRLLAGAALLLAAATCFRDIAELRTSFLLSVLFVGTLLAVLAPGRRLYVAVVALVGAGSTLSLAGHPLAALALTATLLAAAAASGRQPHVLAVASLATVCALALAVFAAAATRGNLGIGRYDDSILPREYFQVWSRVAHVVPRDALVFTTQTGEAKTPVAGWNYYPGVADRQIYIAGWTNSPLSVRPAARAERLRLNLDVFLGRIAPRALRGVRPFSSYYAVAFKIEPHPSSFDEIYANRLFVLYRVPALRHSRTLVRRYACTTYTSCVTLPHPQVVSR